MKASEVKSMSMIRNALAGIPASGASSINEIVFNGGETGVLGYDCGIPEEFASEVSEDGKRVLIGDMNRILQLVGTGLYLRQRGASNEFDERVVAIDRGSKGDGQHWGYPNGAVIDWWDGSTFQKVICIKSGEGEENGNCTDGPDDPVHGINGSSVEKYWQLVEKPTQQAFYGYEACSMIDVSTYDSVTHTYTLIKFARLTLRIYFTVYDPYIAPNLAGEGSMMLFLRPGDKISISDDSITINNKTFSPSISMISKSPSSSIGDIVISYSVYKLKEA